MCMHMQMHMHMHMFTCACTLHMRMWLQAECIAYLMRSRLRLDPGSAVGQNGGWPDSISCSSTPMAHRSACRRRI